MIITKLSASEFEEYLKVIKTIFPIVRILNHDCLSYKMVDKNGQQGKQHSHCYHFWGRSSRCANCISTKVIHDKTVGHKFEVKGDEVYIVFSKYVEVDGVAHIIEMLSIVGNDIITSGFSDKPFAEAIKYTNDQLYKDAMLGIFNRRYYEEQMSSLTNITAVAYIDIDYFKNINDKYSHTVGDKVLKLVVDTLLQHMRLDDVLIRLGGDEFLIAFSKIKKDYLKRKIHSLKNAVRNTKLIDFPEISINISIGGCSFDIYTPEAVTIADEQMYLVKHTLDEVSVEHI